MARIEFENEGLCEMLDELVHRVPAKVPEALEKMGDSLQRKLQANAPYDGSSRHRDKHLREIIKKTKVRSKNGEQYVTVFVSPRGVKGAKPGKRGVKGRNINWDKDKHVFKLVVAEYGSSKQAKKPFWHPTIRASEDELINQAREVLLGEVDRIAK